jgi:hypothetical protein
VIIFKNLSKTDIKKKFFGKIGSEKVKGFQRMTANHEAIPPLCQDIEIALNWHKK